MPSLPPLAIEPRAALDASVRVPGSKSISNRAVLIAALARGESHLSGVLDSDDIRAMIGALRVLGAGVDVHGTDLQVRGVDGTFAAPTQVLDVGASGTAARFLSAAMALAPGESRLDGTPRMRERPVAELVAALQQLGVRIDAEGPNGCPPVRCAGKLPFGGETEIDASRSSQYVSALLLIAPYAQRQVVLKLRDGVLASRPYVDVTLDVMRTFGAGARFAGLAALEVNAGQTYGARDYAIEPDASTAAYFFAAAAIAGGRVRVEGLPGTSMQADMRFLDVLVRMGCEVARDPSSVEVRAPSDGLRAVDVDMNEMPDAVLAAAVTALFARGTTHIRNVGNLRIKETDRLFALETELRKLGADARAGVDSITITGTAPALRGGASFTPGPLHGAEIATYDDHRIAMAFALAGLRVPGVVICDPGCVSKSWPQYFDVFATLR